MYRHSVNKGRAAHKFNHASSKTKRINVAPPPSRGGYRL